MSIGDREYVRRELGRLRVRRHRGTFQLQDDDQMVDGDHNLSSSSSDIEDAPEAIDDYRNFFLNNDLDGYVLSDNDEQIDDVDNHEEIDVADQEKLNDLRELLEDSDDDMIGVDEENDLDEIEKVRQWALKEPPLPHSRLDELLKILRRTRYPELPKCSKIFLGTNNVPYTIEKLTDNDSGEFVYFGITENLKKCVNPELHEVHSMHLVYLGIVKKIFDYWLSSNIKSVKLSKNMKDLLSSLLLQLKSQVPQDFQRTTRKNHKYQLILFLDDSLTKSIDIVPSSWLSYDKITDSTYCKFMPAPYDLQKFKTLQNMVMKCAGLLSSWPEYLVDIRGRANTYEEAEKRLEILEKNPYAYTTDNEKSAELIAINSDEPSDSDEERETMKFPKKIKLQRSGQKNNLPPLSPLSSSNESSFETQSITSSKKKNDSII
ncbi:hypothetical protein KQX54_009166 [Cotesia glomerata]|uniref:Uncharacterized protein n=2 Tax=Cotesia glomerata TaxID=32391 RepID=A0AAV7I1C3_COTGL|nr:hypothetical protein KQX54_009166 [Cotesia glomerata]